jgi:unsaturated chondroitin disaccharide hydrolase
VFQHPMPFTSREAALDSILNRVAVVTAQVADRFPLFADPVSGRWTTSRRGAWTGGFWAGLWWLRVAVLGRDEREVARVWTVRLAPRAGDDTATRGMIFWYGAGSGYRLTGDPVAAEVATLGRSALAAAFEGGQQLVPFGSAFDAPERPARGPCAVIDPLAGIVALLADEPLGLRSLARAHAARYVELCLAGDGAVHPEVSLPSGRAAVSGWARGQAWGMLGFAVAARDVGAEFAEPARRSAAWWLERVRPDETPHAELSDPTSPVDTSAAAIVAAALFTLGAAGGPGAAEYHAAAVGTIEHLVERHLSADGVLGDGCYDHTRGVAPAHELVWGSYFLAATLAVLCGRVDKTSW